MGLDFMFEIEREVSLGQLAETAASACAQHPGQVCLEADGRPYVRIGQARFDFYQSDDDQGADIVNAAFGFRPAVGFITKLGTQEPPFEVDDLIDLCVAVQSALGGAAVLLFLFETPVVLFRDGQIILNEHWRDWSSKRLPTSLRSRAYEIRSLVLV